MQDNSGNNEDDEALHKLTLLLQLYVEASCCKSSI